MITGQRSSAIRLGLFLLAAFGVFVVLFSLSGGRVVPGQQGYRVEAIVPNSFGLSKNGDVRQAGVHIGRMTASRNLGNTTAIMLELDDDHAPVYRDATVLVRTKSVAGENYVELDPGHPRAGSVPDGGRLTIDRSKEATQLDEILSVLSPSRRRQLQRALAGLGGGLDGRGGDLNRLVESLSGTVHSGASVMDTLAADRTHVAGLVDSLGRVTRSLGERGDAIRIFVRQAKVAAEAVAARDAQLDRTLATLPSFLTQTRATAGRLQGFSRQATPVVRDLRLAMQDLAPAVEELRRAAPAGRRVVRELLPFARAVKAPVAALGPFSNAAAGFVPPLGATLREVNPLLAYLKPYWRELATMFGQIGAATKYTDTVGHLGRLAVMFGKASLPGTLPLDQAKMVEQLNKAAGGRADSFGVNAYPAPGEAGQSKAFSGSYPRLEAEPAYTRGAGRGE
jgi:phospholipid/cholesterol/gamma-HCH transport system substrate-binding protein